MSECESQQPVDAVCDRAEFDELIDEMVAEDAPRMFAIVQERGDRLDARVAAWGMAFEDYAALVSADGGLQLSLPSAERGALHYNRHAGITARVVWIYPGTPEEPEDI
jgi:hypothetical protein